MFELFEFFVELISVKGEQILVSQMTPLIMRRSSTRLERRLVTRY